jgi:hypothetical protein
MMTETHWLACTDWDVMLHFFHRMASNRQWCLFACACCRRIWHLHADSRSRAAVEVCEHFADGQATEEEVAAARTAAEAAWNDACATLRDTDYPSAQAYMSFTCKPGDNVRSMANYPAAAAEIHAAGAATGPNPASAAEAAAWAAVSPAVWKLSEHAAGFASFETVRKVEEVAQCHLIRDIFGNPSRPPECDSRWLDWRHGCVWKLPKVSTTIVPSTACPSSPTHWRTQAVPTRTSWAIAGDRGRM